uniref:Uncharacterized protein n=1 Tax=Arundo donax TaxID=35708 RepID=A0A0A8YGE6_ARUDO
MMTQGCSHSREVKIFKANSKHYFVIKL